MDLFEQLLQVQNNEKHNKTKKKGRFKSLRCHPKQFTSKNYKKIPSSCLNEKTIKKMKNIWNKRYPDNKITYKNTKDIWKELKKKFNHSCSNEMCWVDKTFHNTDIQNDIKENMFAPTTPIEWKNNENEWLSSNEIIDVMKQYEDTFDDFKFFGPSPIDFDKVLYKNSCVWPEICNLNVPHLYERKYRKIGFIFNTDTHDKEGSHWVAMYVDLNKNKIFYFDSNGLREPHQITKLKKKIAKQCLTKLNKTMKLDSNHKFEHQRTDSECGMYCLYFIVSLIRKLHNMEFFKKKRIPDKEVEKLRNVYFNNI
jgi:hypothetical protein